MKKLYLMYIVTLLSIGSVVSLQAGELPKVYLIDDFQQTQGVYEKLDEIIIKLNQQEGINHIVLNLGYVEGKRINHYLATGDEVILENIMKDLYPEYRTEEFKNTLNQIYQYNKKNNKSIEVVGMGRDRKENTLEALNQLLSPYSNQYNIIAEDIREINAIPGLDAFEQFKAKVNAYDSIYGDVLEGEQWIEMQLILGGIFENTQGIYNDKMIFNQYKELPILVIQDKEESSFVPNEVETITFEYQDVKTINWDEGIIESFVDTNKPSEGEQVIKIKESEAATPYNYNEKNASNYVAQNSAKIDIKDMKFDGLNALKGNFGTNKLYIAGETHGNIGTYELQEYLIKFFHEEAGVNKILFECSYAMGEMINDYIQTGEEDLLSKIMSEFKNSFFYSKEFEEMLKRLYKYNGNQKNKIEIIGIDVTKKIEQVPYVWNKIFEENKIAEIEKIDVEDFESYREYYKAIRKVVIENKEAYKKVLGKERLLDLEMLLYSLAADFDRYENDMLIRERIIIEMIEKLMITYKDESFFAQMGAFHGSQEYHLKENDGYSCGEYLNKYSEIARGRVVSILYNYSDSYYYGNSGRKNIKENYPEVLYPVKGSYTLIDLSGANNPLSDLYLPWQENGVSDTLQYIIHVNKKDATTRFQ